MKKMLIIAAILALAIGLMVPTAAWAVFGYTTADDVIISMTIPNIQVMDMGASENDVTWVEPTAADLDAGYVVRRYATSFVVDSNRAWRVEVSPYVDEFCDDSSTWSPAAYTGLAVTDLFVRADEVTDTGNDMTIVQATWGAFVSSAASVELCDGDPTSDAQVMVDYKININWDTTAAAYYMKLAYNLESGQG